MTITYTAYVQNRSGRIFRDAAGSCKSAINKVLKMAERVGFEPTEGCPSTVFKTAAFDHSATSPKSLALCRGVAMRCTIHHPCRAALGYRNPATVDQPISAKTQGFSSCCFGWGCLSLGTVMVECCQYQPFDTSQVTRGFHQNEYDRQDSHRF